MNQTLGAAHPHRSISKRLTINTPPAERIGRIMVGAGAIVVAIVLLAGAASVVAVMLELLLAAAGADLVITGALGHCPLYNKLGYVPASLRRPT